LRQLQQEQGRGVELQVSPAVVGHHGVAAVGVVLGVQRIQRLQAVLEALQLRRLAQHGVEQPAHQLQHPLLQFEHAGGGTAQAPVGQGQAPHALHGVDAVAHPGIAVVAMHRVGGAGGQQAGHRVLALQHHPLNLRIESLQPVPGFSRTQLQGRHEGGHGCAGEGHCAEMPGAGHRFSRAAHPANGINGD